ncbi:2-dehydro-3-deoxygalactonokinase [Marinobacter sp. V034]|uniref:2-dehydro-3-deoxygalactonokinase n=1 Tax=Marinobacter sp. V034 TaxID=3459610 RepID=UPI0040439AED
MTGAAIVEIEALKSGRLITIDWGTSNFRSALLDDAGHVIDRIQAPRGILHLAAGEFPTALQELLAPWLPHLPAVPILMAGMVGSADGLFEVPYLPCPARLDDVADALVQIPNVDLDRPVFIVPGLRSQSTAGTHDVMRGEEIQILGAIDDDASEMQTFCLPGTHSKWVALDGRRVMHFSTSMTGDVFAALRNHTILSRFAREGEHNPEAFARGIALAEQPGGLLHHLFSARAEVLLGGLAADADAAYLSGILIGEEVRSMLEALNTQGPVTLIGDGRLTELYAEALSAFGHDTRRIDGDQAAVAGLHYLASHAGLTTSGH